MFPGRAADVLDRDRGFLATDRGWVLDTQEEGSAWRRVRIELPSEAGEAVILRVGDFSIRVKESGIEGSGSRAANSVAYRRSGGASFWTVGGGGVEEWLYLEAGFARDGEPVAVWEVEGASLRQRGAVVEVVDESGFVQMSVTAPKAYAGGEQEIAARLKVAGLRLELFVDGMGDRVLVDPAWSATGVMGSPRVAHKSVKLNDGRILVTGGSGGSGPLSTCETYLSNAWTPAPSMANSRSQHTATLLANGTVLVAGGTGMGANTAEVFDPVTNTWSGAGTMSTSRFEHTATRLNDGRVLVTGGRAGSTYLSSAEIYNPANNTWTTVASMSSGRAYHGAVLLLDGRVFIASGSNDVTYVTAAQIYNPANDTWTSTAPMPSGRGQTGMALLSTGDVLVAGGENDGSSLNVAEVYHPQTNSWSFTSPMGHSRFDFPLVRLSTGRYLAPGYAASEIFVESAGTWLYSGLLSTSRYGHTGDLLDSGTVLVSGGYNSTQTASAELFTPQPQGAACMAAGECQSLNCVDGRCCNTSCVGTCVACSATLKGFGADGVCGNIGAGIDPQNECATQAASTCGTTGFCSGAGSCQVYNINTICVAGSCNGSLATKPDLCNGTGTCIDAGTQQCAPFGCSAGNCYTTCSNDAQCATGNYCAAPNCVAKKAVGAACTGGNQCQSTYCVNGVCCSTACTGTCVACSAAEKGSGTDGTCGNVAAGTDPNNTCTPDGTACGLNGLCNGAGACQKQPSGTVCSPGICSSTFAFKADLCDGNGTCVDGGTQECAPFACLAGACPTECVGEQECSQGHYCQAPSCIPEKGPGQPCTGPEQCQGAKCVDGVCCDTFCDGDCVACSAALKGGGAEGVCGPVAAGTDPDGECADDGAASCQQNGNCNGAGACQIYSDLTVCGPAICSGTLLSLADVCDGVGTCIDGGAIDCAPFGCLLGACYASCVDESQCASTAYCDGAVCQLKATEGTPCASGEQCLSGFCAEGVCCNLACDGLCETCVATKKGFGTDGACGFVLLGTDPDDECSDDLDGCQNNGLCDGAGACQKDAPGSSCSLEKCSGSVWSPADTCDSAGNCVNSATQDCGLYVCGGTTCLTECSDDSDCVPTAYCDGSICALKEPDGVPCESAGDCQSGVCVDDVCCNNNCNAPCWACSTGKKGQGVDGLCEPVMAGSDPDDDCTEGVGACADTGFCDGDGSCQKTSEDCMPTGGAAGEATGGGGASGSGASGGTGGNASSDPKSFYSCALRSAETGPAAQGWALLAALLGLLVGRRLGSSPPLRPASAGKGPHREAAHSKLMCGPAKRPPGFAAMR